MLFVIDVGNTNTVLGLFEGATLRKTWRLQTNTRKTEDEYGVLVRQLFDTAGVALGDVEACVLASVVPPMTSTIRKMVRRYFDTEPLVVGPGLKSGMPIRYENPREVGADRIVNAVAAYARTGGATIVVDFGTATTFDAISEKGEYLGGCICTGVVVSAEALYLRASKLPHVDIAVPDQVIGRNTEASMQSGLVWGYVAMVDGMIERMRRELSGDVHVVATGGLAPLFAEHCASIDAHDADLTLTGLRLLFERNR